MITYTEIGRNGRLGNQLFQYAILKAVSLKKGYEIVLPKNVLDNEWHGQKCLLGNFKLKSCNFREVSYNNVYSETLGHHYDDSLFNVPDNTNFSGFFQHHKYYSGIISELRNEFKLNDKVQDKALNYISKFKKPVVSLHIRRGDLSNGVSEEDRVWTNDISEDSIFYKYYSQSLKSIPSDSIILLFTGGSRDQNGNLSDLEWCKNTFKDERIIFIENMTDIDSFALMKNCHYNITSFASTFSWWASFLNENNNIIAPKIYYPSYPELTFDKVYPEYWNLL